jgi:hypothetical protein
MDQLGEMKRKEEIRRLQESEKMGGGGDIRAKLENLLGEDMRAKAAQENERQAEVTAEQAQRWARSKVPRNFARPVEVVLNVYNNEKSTLYDVLKVSRKASDLTLKKAYRGQALMVHPDKNPHPDAKTAFDCLQEAYTTLADPSARESYEKMQMRKSKFSMKKFKKKVQLWKKNIRSRYLLFVHRMKNGQASEEYEEIVGARLKELSQMVTHWLEKVVLVPTALDRAKLVGEVYYDNLKGIMITSLVVRSILLPFF